MTPLEKIQTNVKKIRRAHPKMTYQEALKKASAEYNRTKPKMGAKKTIVKKKLSGTVKKEVAGKKTVAKKTVTKKAPVRTAIRGVDGIDLKNVNGEIFKLEFMLPQLKRSKSEAKTQAEKKRITAEISRITKQLGHLRAYIKSF